MSLVSSSSFFFLFPFTLGGFFFFFFSLSRWVWSGLFFFFFTGFGEFGYWGLKGKEEEEVKAALRYKYEAHKQLKILSDDKLSDGAKRVGCRELGYFK